MKGDGSLSHDNQKMVLLPDAVIAVNCNSAQSKGEARQAQGLDNIATINNRSIYTI